MSNLKDVALMAGVSVSTVSRALDQKSSVSSATRKRVMAAVRKLDYQPNVVAKSLKMGSTHTIALMVPDIQNLYLPMIVRGVEDTARSNGFTIILCNTDEDMDVEKEYIGVLRNRWIDGFVISSMHPQADHIRRLRDEGFPVVLTSRYYGDDFDTVEIDNVAAAYNAVRYLYEKSNRKIAIALGDIELNVYGDRFAGYKKALSDLGLPFKEHYVVREKEGGASTVIEPTARLCATEDCPDAIFATNDNKAMAVMRALHDIGKKIPEDVSVLGFDDIALSSLVQPPLTTVHQPLYEIGVEAVRKLLKQIEAKKAGKKYLNSIELLKTEIVERDSTCGRP